MKRKTLLTTAAAFVLAGGLAAASAQTQLTGAGSTFINPVMTKWAAEYHKVDPSVQINYQSIGSGAGIKQISEGTVDFGATDGPMTDAAIAKLPGKILHIPTVAGGVVLTYNLPGVSYLKLDGPSIANIYLGKVTKWNDPEIAKQNSGVKLPDTDIAVVHRADGSGTTYIFTDYLSTVSGDWKSKVGKNTAVSWPTGIGAKGTDGVSGQVKQVPGAIGYVELIYALQNKLLYAEVKNADGEYVKPSLESVTAALSTATIPDDFRFSFVNATGKTSYPISGVTWLLVYQQQKSADKGAKLVSFLKWILNDGEKMATDLDYASLPENVRERVLKAVDTIKQ
jgi:phosphate transport system substrate-binding protein